MNYYVKLALSLLAGNKDEARLLRDSEKAKSALKAQISIREGKRFALEDAVTEAKESLIKNEVSFTTAESYIETLISAKNNVTLKEKELNNFDKVTMYLEEVLEKITKEEKK